MSQTYTTYEGNEPYIFVSYSHKDTELVMPIIRGLQEHGFRVWYDEGIEAGTEWAENISKHLKNSTCMLCFMSPNAAGSLNCRNEISLALDSNVQQLCICLDDSPISAGLSLQMASVNHVRRNSSESETAFLERIKNAKELQACRESGTPHPPSPASETDTSMNAASYYRNAAENGSPETITAYSTNYPEPLPMCASRKSRFRLPTLFSSKKKKDHSRRKEKKTAEISVSNVEFSVIAPKQLQKHDHAMIHLFMYENEFRSVVENVIRASEIPVQETTKGMYQVSANAEVQVQLTSPDFDFYETEEHTWHGEYLNFSFAVLLPDDFNKHQVLFQASVRINGLPVTKLNFIVKCFSLREQKINITRKDFHSAFMSYASQDRSRVAMIIQGMKKISPNMEIFFDVDTLRSGEDWESTLLYEIENRDIFFLCWSQFARDSEWVDKEWHHALAQKGAEYIEPIPLEPPYLCPPPKELSKKHFNDRLLYYTTVPNTPPDR